MKVNDEALVQNVIRLLNVNGISAKRMPELRSKTCDIVASANGQNFYIEVKERLGPSGPGSFTLNVGYRSSVHKIIEEGAKQLRSMPQGRQVRRILWFVIGENDDDTFLTNGIIHTLYGVERVKLSRGELSVETDCFYFRHSPFRKWSFLDLAIIQTISGLIFCLNPESNAYTAIRRSPIFKLPKRLDGVVDPAVAEKDGRCHIASPGKSEEIRAKETLRKYRFECFKTISTKRVSDSIRFQL